MTWVATAQPIDAAGRIGFEDRPPIERDAMYSGAALTRLGFAIDEVEREGVTEFHGAPPAWDITLIEQA